MFEGRYWHQHVDDSAHLTRGEGDNRVNWITEIQTGTFQVGTQLDSLGHLQIGDRFYNGWTVEEIVAPWGLKRFGMETVPPVVTRGVVLDLAAYRGVERLEAGTVISRADLRGALERRDLSLRAGDAVLLHTGWGGLWEDEPDRFLSGQPGPDLAAARFLYEQRVALVGADTWSIGPVPGTDPDRPFQVPQTMYVKWGLFGLENLATERLVEREVDTFLSVLTHGRTRGSTAAVVSPAAVY